MCGYSGDLFVLISSIDHLRERKKKVNSIANKSVMIPEIQQQNVITTLI